MRPLFSQWITTKLTSSPTFSYSTLISVSTPLQLFLGSPSTAIFADGQIFPLSRSLSLYFCFLLGPLGFLRLVYNAFLWPLLTYASPRWFPFLSVTNITKLERLHRATSRTITGCLSSSPIPLLLSETSLFLHTSHPDSFRHFMSGLFVSQSPFPFQVWPDME